MRLLVTGGAGYIGSHTCVALLAAGHDVFVVDDFSNSDRFTLAGIATIAGKPVEWIRADVGDRKAMRTLLANAPKFDAIVHLAALKSGPESTREPARYWSVNVGGISALIEVAMAAGIDKVVFMSSAAVYGEQGPLPISERSIPTPITPYARTKHAVEHLLSDITRSQGEFRACILRCFNPIGAHESVLLGERISAEASLLQKIAIARRNDQPLEIYGVDFDTADGTAVRDFVDVGDIADGVAAAVDLLAQEGSEPGGLWTFNLGTGIGRSVLQLIKVVEAIGAKDIRLHRTAARRDDISISVADPTQSTCVLKWQPRRRLEHSCASALRWYDRHQ